MGAADFVFGEEERLVCADALTSENVLCAAGRLVCEVGLRSSGT